MYRTITLATAGLCLALASAGSASVTAPVLAAPPAVANPASAEIFDAMIAIGRAAAIRPASVETATQTYATAIQQYNAGNLTGARQSAIQAIAETHAVTRYQPTNPPPNVSPTPPAYLPQVTSVTQAEMEERLALARRSLSACGATTGTPYLTASATYRDAVQNQLTQHANALNGQVQSIIDTCAAAPPVAAVAPASGS
jgi:hypothetical protein